MTEPAGGEEDPRLILALRMAVIAMFVLTIVQQGLCLAMAVQYRHHILDGYPVAGLVEIDRIDVRVALHETVDDEQLRHDIEGAAGMAAQAFDVGVGREEDQTVTDQSDVCLQS